jgi:hypothetical protein
MIVRINGAFGAGETTLAQELHRRLLDALPFYPDAVRVVATTVLKDEVGAGSCVMAGDLAARADSAVSDARLALHPRPRRTVERRVGSDAQYG